MADKERQVLIIGGGFAGWWAAKSLARKVPKNAAQIVLVDQRPDIHMLPALPDVAAGSIAPEYLSEQLRTLLPDSVAVVTDRIEQIDLARRVATGGRGDYLFDYLVLAAGSATNFFGFQPGNESVYTLTSIESAQRIHDDLQQYLNTAATPRAVVVGAGYTGLELAVALRTRADALGRDLPITVLEKAPTLLPFLEAPEREYIATHLAAKDIEIRLGSSATALTDGVLQTEDGEQISNPFFCWAAGARRALDGISGDLPLARDGRILVDEFLEVPGMEGIFVAGDAAAISDGDTILRRSINFSLYSGRHAGVNIARRIAGRAPIRFKPVDLGWVIPLGEISVGRVFGKFRVKGKLGMRLHYVMNGYRNFNTRNFFAFFGLSLKLPKRGRKRSAA